MKPKPYVIISSGGRRRIEKHATAPTLESRSRPEDFAAIGPFQTMRGAVFMRDRHSPHCVCVQDAEQLANLPSVREYNANVRKVRAEMKRRTTPVQVVESWRDIQG